MISVAFDAPPLTRRQRAAEVAGPLVLSALLALLVLTILAGAALALDTAYARRALPGVTVGGVAVGSLEAGALRERLHDAASRWPAGAVETATESRTWIASDASLGLSPDSEAALGAALGFG